MPSLLSGVCAWLFDLFLRAFVLTVIASVLLRILRPVSPGTGFRYRALITGVLLLLPLILLLPCPLPFRDAPVERLSVTPTGVPGGVRGGVPGGVSGGIPGGVVTHLDATNNDFPIGEYIALLPTLVVPRQIQEMVVIVALTMTMVMGYRLLIGYVGMTRMIRRCRAVTDGDLAILLDEARETLAVHSRVELRIEEDENALRVPLTVGWRHPVVVLPWNSFAHPVEQIQMTLLHEVAHIKRSDWLLLLLAEITRVLYAANPFVWRLVDDLRVDAEMAADELVVRAGIRPTDYAGLLIELSRNLTGKSALPSAVAMAATPSVTQRVQRLLTADTLSHPINPYRFAYVLTMMIALPLLIGVNRVPVQAQSDEPPPTPALIKAVPASKGPEPSDDYSELLQRLQQNDAYFVRKAKELHEKEQTLNEVLLSLQRKSADMQKVSANHTALKALEQQRIEVERELVRLQKAEAFATRQATISEALLKSPEKLAQYQTESTILLKLQRENETRQRSDQGKLLREQKAELKREQDYLTHEQANLTTQMKAMKDRQQKLQVELERKAELLRAEQARGAREAERQKKEKESTSKPSPPQP